MWPRKAVYSNTVRSPQGCPCPVGTTFYLSFLEIPPLHCPAPAFSTLMPGLALETEWQEPGQSSGSPHDLYTQVFFDARFWLAGLLMVAKAWVSCPHVHELGFRKLLNFVLFH